ncbi:unnamed protein product [Arabidopsis thaliana]|uniref:(thale cress) hypothetical protein n=1 Tax=Arabidopsis thaliana TaxID=3702 RepID=A0A7G2FDP7_ARATH|nr:unnamed protein product [Arabidopsis thaliana]
MGGECISSSIGSVLFEPSSATPSTIFSSKADLDADDVELSVSSVFVDFIVPPLLLAFGFSVPDVSVSFGVGGFETALITGFATVSSGTLLVSETGDSPTFTFAFRSGEDVSFDFGFEPLFSCSAVGFAARF